MAGCRDNQTLVYRSAYHDYVCVEPSTADRWKELGFAEIIQENPQSTKEINKTETTEFIGAPPPPPQRSLSDVTADCRPGFTLVHRITYDDLYCINSTTAITWERLGLVEMIKNSISEQDDVPVEITSNLSSENIFETIELPLEKEQETMVGEEQETMVEEEQETFIDEESEFVKDTPQNSNDSDAYPIIRQINKNIWNAIDYDGSTSFIIEGDEGIIVINSLSSYNSNKEIIDEFQKISTKQIRSIILTNISSEILFNLDAYIEKSDARVNIIIYENLPLFNNYARY